MLNARYSIELGLEALLPEPDPNETRAETRRRLQILREHMAASALAGRRRGVRPKESTITRDVEWFYRADLKTPKETIHALAREYHATVHLGQPPADHRPTVKAGIKRAKYLLGEVPAFTDKPD